MTGDGRVAVEFEGRLNVAADGKTFRCDFIREGPVNAGPKFGIEVLRRATIERDLKTMIGKPLIIEHVDPALDPAMLTAHGRVNNVGFDAETGFFFAEGSVDTDEGRAAAIVLKPSCGYRVKGTGAGGRWNNISFDRELTGLEFHHLALCKGRVRYEESDFRLNAVTNEKGEITMFNFLFKKKSVVDGKTVETAEEHALPSDAVVKIGDTEHRLNSLVESYQKTEADRAAADKKAADDAKLKRDAEEATARTNAITDETEIVIDGKKVTVGALKQAHAASELAKSQGKDSFARLNAAATATPKVALATGANSAADKSTRGKY